MAPYGGEETCHPRVRLQGMALYGGWSHEEAGGRRDGGPGEGCASPPPACAGSGGRVRWACLRSPSRSGSPGESRLAEASRDRTCSPCPPSSASCTSIAGSGTRSSPETRGSR